MARRLSSRGLLTLSPSAAWSLSLFNLRRSQPSSFQEAAALSRRVGLVFWTWHKYFCLMKAPGWILCWVVAGGGG